MGLGNTKHSLELRAGPQCTTLRASPFTTLRLGRFRPPRLRTFGGIVDSGQDRRLRLGGMAVGPLRLMPTHVCRQQINYRRGQPSPKLGTGRARDEGKRGPNATAGLLCRRGRLCLAGTKGILVSSDPVRRLYFRYWRLVRDPVSVPARPESVPTARSHSRRAPLHRPAHSGNLRHPASRLRTPCNVGARYSPLTQDRRRRCKRSCRIVETVINAQDLPQRTLVVGMEMRSLAGSPYSRQASRYVVENQETQAHLPSHFGTASAMSPRVSCDSLISAAARSMRRFRMQCPKIDRSSYWTTSSLTLARHVPTIPSASAAE